MTGYHAMWGQYSRKGREARCYHVVFQTQHCLEEMQNSCYYFGIQTGEVTSGAAEIIGDQSVRGGQACIRTGHALQAEEIVNQGVLRLKYQEIVGRTQIGRAGITGIQLSNGQQPLGS